MIQQQQTMILSEYMDDSGAETAIFL